MLSIPAHSSPSTPSGRATPSPNPHWKRLVFALLAGGFALQLGALPAEARSSSASVRWLKTNQIWAIATPQNKNVSSNDDLPRRGDTRPR